MCKRKYFYSRTLTLVIIRRMGKNGINGGERNRQIPILVI